MTALHHDKVLRAHFRRYGLDSHGHRRLQSALKTLELCDGALRLASAGAGVDDGSLERVRAVLRLLVDGPENEFRKLR